MLPRKSDFKNLSTHIRNHYVVHYSFAASDEGNLPLLSCLVGVYQSVLTLIRQLKQYFSDGQRRQVFFSAHLRTMTSPVFSGGQDLHGQKEQVICNAILKPLFAYFCSNTEVDLSEDLHVKCCVISLDHTAKYDRKKRPSLKGPPPEDHLVGALQEIHQQTVQHRSLIAIPRGTPQDPDLFKDRCLPVAFCMGKMLFKAAYQGKEEAEKMIEPNESKDKEKNRSDR